MMTAKEAVSQILRDVPETATYDDIMYRIYAREKVEAGLADADKGSFAKEDEVQAELDKWPTA